MTEAEWLAADDPRAMLGWLTGDPRVRGGTNPPVVQPSVRKLRLFAVACWANSPPRRPVPAWIESLLQLEELAEGKRGAFNPSLVGYVCACVDVDDLLRHLSGLWVGENVSREARQRRKAFAASALRDIFGNLFQPVTALQGKRCGCISGMEATQGNELRPCHECGGSKWIEPPSPWLIWNDGIIPKLARQMYDSRDFSGMPILADALEEAGCMSQDILMHCRGLEHCPRGCGRGKFNKPCVVCGDTYNSLLRGPHVRGCWAIDMLVGRE